MKDTFSLLSKRHVILLAAIAVAMLALVMPAMQVKAAQPQLPPTPNGQRLGLLYDRVSLAADNQGNRIEYSKEIATEAQKWIDTLKEDGQDVSALEDALATFNQGIAKAEESHNMAVDVLNTQAGFDEAGNVTDASQARETIHKAAISLRQAHLTLTQATIDFRSAVHDWRQTHES